MILTPLQVVQELTPITPKNKKVAAEKIEDIRTETITNLWHGIREGLKLFKPDDEISKGKVQALMVLTDGLPNHM